MSNTIEAWHFVDTKLRDGRPIPADGELLGHEGNVCLCESGLHASERLIDALRYAPGTTLCRVTVGGHIVHGADKLCATERTIQWRINAKQLLMDFACWAALEVNHLWEAPPLVVEFLKTGNQNIRSNVIDLINSYKNKKSFLQGHERDAAYLANCAAWYAAAKPYSEDAAQGAAQASAGALARLDSKGFQLKEDACLRKATNAQNSKLIDMVTKAYLFQRKTETETAT
jgi:hypothetical protein